MKSTFQSGLGLEIATMFEATSLALVGASDREGSLGKVMYENLTTAGFKGNIIPVNPRTTEIDGNPCYASVTDIPDAVDLAVIVTPAAAVPMVLEQCGGRGITSAVILSAGFRETGEQGRALEAQTLKVARQYGIRFIGPNCLGIMRPSNGLNATFSQSMARPGHVALVSQSGALCTAVLDWAAPKEIGFSCVISSGIAADVDFGELLDYLTLDTETHAIMLYVEGINDSRRFMSALRAASRAKPVIVMKSGRHAGGSQAAVSHTGALVGSDDVFDAALNRAGVVRVYNYSNFFAVAETLHTGLRTPGPRLAVVTNGGGPGVMAADHMADRNLPLAQLSDGTCRALDEVLPQAWSGGNPIDVLGDASAEMYADAARIVLEDPGVDGVLAIHVPQAMTEPEPVARRIADLAVNSKKPVLTCWMGKATMMTSRAHFRDLSVPTYPTPEAAVEAFAAAAAYQANQQMLLQVPEPLDPRVEPDYEGIRLIIEGALADGRSVLDLVESKAVLAAFGLPVVRSIPAHSPAEALAIGAELGFPLALKIHSPDITHKSDVNGVKLGINNGAELRAAYKELTESAEKLRPDARITGVLIEPMTKRPNARELMLGVLNDPVFGPVISVGLGGTMVEVIGDRAVGLPPLNRFLARRMIEGTRAAKYLREFRGKPAASLRALEDVILSLSDLVCELPWVRELDINPLVVDDEGCLALDARIVVERVSPTAARYAHMSIHPYPSDLKREFNLVDGTRLTIRPIRPEDAANEREFVNGLSENSRYLRFMSVLKQITPKMLSRFTQIDYDREMALVALLPVDGGEKQIGVARYVTYPDGRTCEFAVVVADDWHQKGIGRELMRRLIEVARDRGLERIEGLVLKNNQGMVGLASEMGFERMANPDDSKTVLVKLDL